MYSQANSWSSPHHFDSRAFFRTSSTPAELVIDKLRENDEGVYRCRVDFRNSPTRNQKVNLTIIGKSLSGQKQNKDAHDWLIAVPVIECRRKPFSGRLFITAFPQLLTIDWVLDFLVRFSISSRVPFFFLPDCIYNLFQEVKIKGLIEHVVRSVGLSEIIRR